MPPLAIASQVASAIASAAAPPVRSWWRSRNSHVIEGGNFGARPKPPCSLSNPLARPATAVAVAASRLSSPAAPPGPDSAEAFSARATDIRSDSLLIFALFFLQASDTEVTSWTNWALGKYVPQ